MSATWQPGDSAPRDGTVIVADGHVFWRDDVSFGTEPFLARVRWSKGRSECAGWHYTNGMCVASTPADEVRIHHWVLPPEGSA